MVHNEAVIHTTLSVAEVAKYLGISRTLAYELVHREDFPSFRPKPGGRRILVRQDDLDQWIANQRDRKER